MVGETVQGHSLLGHELAGALVCLGVVDTNTAEHSEGFHCQDIFLVKSFAIKLKVVVDVCSPRNCADSLTLFMS